MKSFIKYILLIMFCIMLVGCKEHVHDYTKQVVQPTCTNGGYTIYNCECGNQKIDDFVAQLKHEQLIVNGYAATCTEKGKTDKVICKNCNQVILDHQDIPETSHEYSEYEIIKEATEDEVGIMERKCLKCGSSQQKEISKLKHEHNYKREIIAPKCTEQGYTKYYCKCGDTYNSDYSHAMGHEYGEYKITKEATEDEPGIRERICNRCNNTEYQSIPPLNHTHEYEKTVTSPSCETTGNIKFECLCGDKIEETIPALGHIFLEHNVYKYATEQEEGIIESKCSKCGFIQISLIPKLNHVHNLLGIVIAPTCTKKGFTKYVCECGQTYDANETDMLPHKYSTVVVNPTCTKEGYTVYTCECGHTYNGNTTQKLPHKYSTEVINPTCTKEGYTKYTCECGHTYNDKQTGLAKHIYGEWKIIKAATEKEEGQKEKECINCNNVVKETISKIPHVHDYFGLIVPPTCEEKGYTKYTCECGHTYNDKYYDAIGHKFGEYKVTKEATETEVGSKEKQCVVCGKTEKEEIPMLVHTHKYIGVIIAPTCTKEGYTMYVCNCKDMYNDEYVNKLEHKYINLEVVEEPTCEAVGKAKGKCEYCGIEATIDIPSTDIHEGEIVLMIKEPSCAEFGEAVYLCTKCNQNYIDKVEKNENHVPVQVGIIKEPTCTTPGAAKMKCKYCDKDLGYTPIEAKHTPFLVDLLKEATCTEAGLGKYICEFCATDLGYIEIPKSHTWGEIVVETYPTPEKNGLAVQICDKCGQSQTIDLIYKEENK